MGCMGCMGCGERLRRRKTKKELNSGLGTSGAPAQDWCAPALQIRRIPAVEAEYFCPPAPK